MENAFDVLHSPSRDAIAALGFLLLAIFMFWLAVAEAIYIETIGYEPAASIPNLLAKSSLHPPAGCSSSSATASASCSRSRS